LGRASRLAGRRGLPEKDFPGRNGRVEPPGRGLPGADGPGRAGRGRSGRGRAGPDLAGPGLAPNFGLGRGEPVGAERFSAGRAALAGRFWRCGGRSRRGRSFCQGRCWRKCGGADFLSSQRGSRGGRDARSPRSGGVAPSGRRNFAGRSSCLRKGVSRRCQGLAPGRSWRGPVRGSGREPDAGLAPGRGPRKGLLWGGRRSAEGLGRSTAAGFFCHGRERSGCGRASRGGSSQRVGRGCLRKGGRGAEVGDGAGVGAAGGSGSTVVGSEPSMKSSVREARVVVAK
jgi:hypothetical protein